MLFVEEGDRYAVNQRVCRLTATDIVGKFLFYFLNRNIHLLSFDDGINQTHLSKGAVLDCPINAPEKIKEQERIADFLSSLDALIAAQANKLDAPQDPQKRADATALPQPGGMTCGSISITACSTGLMTIKPISSFVWKRRPKLQIQQLIRDGQYQLIWSYTKNKSTFTLNNHIIVSILKVG